MLDIVSHPHHQGLKDCFLVGDVDVVAGEQLNNLSRGEQQELLVLNDLQKVFLEDRGDMEEADNHQSLAEGYDRCHIVRVFVHQRHKDTDVQEGRKHIQTSLSLLSYISNREILSISLFHCFVQTDEAVICFLLAQ